MKKLFLSAVMTLLCATAMAAKPAVTVLATGGTIAGAAAKDTQTTGYTAAVMPVDNLLGAVPEINNIAKVSGEQIAQIDSKNMTPAVWVKLAVRINKLLSGKTDGIVITHGTDTMEETAYFLNLTVKSDKPVVLTGAMRPATALSADGPMNIYNAVGLAASPSAKAKGVLVLLNDQINAAREVSKTSTYALDTFRPQDLGLLGYVRDGVPMFYRVPLRRHTTESEFKVNEKTVLPRVDIIYGYAGIGRDGIDAAVKAGAKGIIYAGAGNGSVAESAYPALAEAAAKGIAVVRASRTGSGPVTRNGEENDDASGFAVSDSLSPQKARVLLMLALERGLSGKDIQRVFSQY